jgi:hypothetical protein
MAKVSRTMGRLEAKWDGIVGEGKIRESHEGNVKYDKASDSYTSIGPKNDIALPETRSKILFFT